MKGKIKGKRYSGRAKEDTSGKRRKGLICLSPVREKRRKAVHFQSSEKKKKVLLSDSIAEQNKEGGGGLIQKGGKENLIPKRSSSLGDRRKLY